MFASRDGRPIVMGALVLALVASATPASAVAAGPPEPQEPPTEDSEGTATEETSLEVRWYGYLKLDSSWDESLIDPGNFARWVTSPSMVQEHPHFNMTARQSRLGVDLEHADGDGAPIRAKIEIDFYGGGAENKNRPQLRHAYFDLTWPNRGWTLSAGQTADVISPLSPPTLNYTVAWWVGNIGYRRPLLSLTRSTASAPDRRTELTIAVSRTIGDDFGAPEPGDSGVDSGVPTVQVAASRFWPLGGEQATVGLSGHWGRERLEEALAGPAPEFESWSANLHLRLPTGMRGTVEGEAWTGRNLDDYFGGIGQGIDFAREAEVEAAGGWVGYKAEASSRVRAWIGFGIDNPRDETLPAGGRSRNTALWAGASWDPRAAVRLGAEVSGWRTEYLELENGASGRLQTSVIYSFGG